MDPNIEHWNFTELKEKLRMKYPQLKDKDMQHEVGKEDIMLRMVEYKLHKTKEEMHQIILGL